MFNRQMIALCLCLLPSILYAAAPLIPQHIGEAWVYTITNKTYQQAHEDLVAAIEAEGMVVSDISHVKDMLDRTSSDLGYKDQVYDTGAETLLFCKSDLSQVMMRDNPHNIAFCPYGISIYTLKSEPNKVFMSYKNPVNMKVYQPIHHLLNTLIQHAAE